MYHINVLFDSDSKTIKSKNMKYKWKKWTFENFLKSHDGVLILKNMLYVINFFNERYLI